MINAGTSEKICDRLGTWKVKNIPIQFISRVTTTELVFLKRTGKVFECTEMLPEFPHSSKDLILSNDGTVWVSNEHKGVFHLEVDPKKISL